MSKYTLLTDGDGGEELSEALNKWQQNELDEANLRRRLSDFITVHERSYRQTFQLLQVTLRNNTQTIYLLTYSTTYLLLNLLTYLLTYLINYLLTHMNGATGKPSSFSKSLYAIIHKLFTYLFIYLRNDLDTKRYLQRYNQQFTNDKMFLQTYSNLNMMLNKNDDVKRNMSNNIY